MSWLKWWGKKQSNKEVQSENKNNQSAKTSQMTEYTEQKDNHESMLRNQSENCSNIEQNKEQKHIKSQIANFFEFCDKNNKDRAYDCLQNIILGNRLRSQFTAAFYDLNCQRKQKATHYQEAKILFQKQKKELQWRDSFLQAIKFQDYSQMSKLITKMKQEKQQQYKQYEAILHQYYFYQQVKNLKQTQKIISDYGSYQETVKLFDYILGKDQKKIKQDHHFVNNMNQKKSLQNDKIQKQIKESRMFQSFLKHLVNKQIKQLKKQMGNFNEDFRKKLQNFIGEWHFFQQFKVVRNGQKVKPFLSTEQTTQQIQYFFDLKFKAKQLEQKLKINQQQLSDYKYLTAFIKEKNNCFYEPANLNIKPSNKIQELIKLLNSQAKVIAGCDNKQCVSLTLLNKNIEDILNEIYKCPFFDKKNQNSEEQNLAKIKNCFVQLFNFIGKINLKINQMCQQLSKQKVLGQVEFTNKHKHDSTITQINGECIKKQLGHLHELINKKMKQQEQISNKVKLLKNQKSQICLYLKWILQKNSYLQNVQYFKNIKQNGAVYNQMELIFSEINIETQLSKMNWVQIFSYMEETTRYFIKLLHLAYQEREQLKTKLNSQHQIHPFNYQYKQLFPGSQVLQTFEDKSFLYQQIQKYTQKKITKTKLLFKTDSKRNPHHYIDDHSNIVVMIKTHKDKIIGGFSESAISKKDLPNGKGFIFSANLKSLYKVLQGKQTVKYNQQSIIFGNLQLRIKLEQNILQSNIGVNKKHYNSGQLSVNQFLGEGEFIRQTKMVIYEVYQVIFDGQTEQQQLIIPVKNKKAGENKNKQRQQEQQKQILIERQYLKLLQECKLLKQQNLKLLKNNEIKDNSLNWSISQIQSLKNNIQGLKKTLEQQINMKLKLEQEILQKSKYIQQNSSNFNEQQIIGNNLKNKIKQNEVLNEKLCLINKTLIEKQNEIKQLTEQLTLSKNKEQQLNNLLKNQTSTLEQKNQKINSMENIIKQLKQKQEQIKAKENKFKNQLQTLNEKISNQNNKIVQLNKVITDSNLRNFERLFVGDVLDNQPEGRKFLITEIQSLMKQKIQKSRLLFKFDLCNKTNFHQLIDNHPNLVLILKLENGNIIGGYTQSAVSQKHENQKAIIFNITKRQVFKKNYKSQNCKSYQYDQYYLMFGNSQIRIKHLDRIVYSNFAIMNNYFETNNKSCEFFLGEASNPNKPRQATIMSYQFFEIFFQKPI